MEPKSFQMGFRVEHPQDFIDRAVWRDLAGHPALGPADYRLVVKRQDRTVYSFCMCPGGEIMAAVSGLRHMNTNGMSHTGRSTGFANSGLVTTLEPESFGGDGPLAGLELQERFEARAAELVGRTLEVPAQRLLDYVEGVPSEKLPPCSCLTGIRPVSLAQVVPPVVDRAVRDALRGMDSQIRGFLHPEALLVGPEARSSSPVRLVRDPGTLQSPGVEGLHPVGEGAGHAGGIVSAAVDGLRVAQQVVSRHAPPVTT